MKKIVLILTLLSCNNHQSNDKMEIKYTSINDFYANYVFNYEDNLKGLQKLNNYVINDINLSKKISDSIKIKLNSLTEEDRVKFIGNQSLPTIATDIILYKEINEFHGEPTDQDILLKYHIEEDNYKIKDIYVPISQMKKIDTKLDEKSHNDNKCIIQINSPDINLEKFHLIIEKIKKIGYHNNYQNYKYTIENKKGKVLLSVLYDTNGNYINLKF
ncbi:hypothetical protein [Chryseobacterium luteum]|uniref:Uncharacterized protein n=1 Tax=Chryseobacterium luteum TaxID=421531 RepID=A0A085YY35_9FLAO|nr:hypothetical protein [Chryseobacterium luteum]KFE97098.1 hypothetical protein IX38_21485 [Chryseobacterium luteum]